LFEITKQLIREMHLNTYFRDVLVTWRRVTVGKISEG